MRRSALLLALSLLAGQATMQGARASEPRHGLSAFGDLKYPPDFAHFDYVNPSAPKGGVLRMPMFGGTFYSLHPFIRQGRAAAGITSIYDTLLERAWDEPSALYGLLAETVELADDRSWIEFVLRPGARWHDGEPVTASDVVFTIEILKEKGSPTLKTLLLPVTDVEELGPHRVRIHISGHATRQLPLQIGGSIRILPQHYWATREFDKTTVEPPLGSGPYRVAKVGQGRSVTYERVRDYWGKELNVNVGRFNYDRFQYKYFQDWSLAREAFKGHDLDWMAEYVPKAWATAYDTPARRRGHFIQEYILMERPASWRGRTFNLRRRKFQDPRVREALFWAYDHQWADGTLFYGGFPHRRSQFEASDMEHWGPPSPEERVLLEPFRNKLDPRVFERQWDPPATSGEERNRENLLIADRLLREAGWIVRDGVRVNVETGEPFEIDFLLVIPEFKPVTLSYAESLKRLGIRVKMRQPHAAGYQNLVYRRREFDMIYTAFGHGLVPGAELRNLFGSGASETPYSRNVAGIENPVVDSLVEKIIAARSRAELVAAVRALDRVLSWSFYFMSSGNRIGSYFAYWNIFGRPERQPRFASGFPFTWWIDPVKQRLLTSGEPMAPRSSSPGTLALTR